LQEAQASKAPIQAYADKVSSVFGSCVLTLACLSFVCWYAILSSPNMPPWARTVLSNSSGDPFLFSLLTAVAVTIVACPCALGLATPTAVMVGTGVGARHGVLIKGGAAFEAAQKVHCVV
ncbi:unnamed protein product, partial [Discosporangium mesarthrocarpum]